MSIYRTSGYLYNVAVPSSSFVLSYSPALWLDASDQSTLVMDGARTFASASSQYLSCVSNSTLNVGTSWFIGFWWYKTATESTWLVSKDDKVATREFAIYTNGANIALMQHIGGSARAFFGPSVSTNNAWYFVAAGYDGNTLRISINNGTPTTASYTGAVIYSAAEFRIGGSAASTDYLNGRIDSVCYCKNPTTSFSDLATYLYNSGSGRRSSDFISSAYYSGSGAVSWWDMDARSGNETDRIGSNNLTDNGGVGYAAGVASGLVQYTGDPVKQWSDKSGNARHLIAPSDAARPTYTTSVQNGLPGILSDGVNDCMSISGSTATFNYLHNAQGAVFVVLKPANATNIGTDNYILGNNAGASAKTGYCISINDASNLRKVNNFVTRSSAGNPNINNTSNSNAVTLTAFQIFSDVIDAANGTAADRSEIRINGGTAIKNNTRTDTPSSGNATHDFQIFAAGNSVGMNSPMVLCEVLVFPTALSSAQRQQVERYLGNKWGITVA